MDPKGLLSLSLLLLLSLVFHLSEATGGSQNCRESFWPLGRDISFPLTEKAEEINKSMNKSNRILITISKSPEDSVRRIIMSLSLHEGSSSDYIEDGYQFHLENLSLVILGSKKQHEGWYSMNLEGNGHIKLFCVQLKLYEQVSTPEIQVLNKTQENDNGTCSLMIACSVKQGDHVAYNWSEEGGTPLPSPPNSSHLLFLTLGPQHADNFYICTASNSVSSRSQAFNLWSNCRSDPSERRQWGLYSGLLLGGLVGVILILTLILEVVILLWRRRGKAKRFQPAMEEKSLTIYAQVQKSGPLQKEPDPQPTQDPCTTIYVAATEPAPESAPEPNPITVYASVTLPES
ncbi:PREDICTED: signaling lymphocytic activation molecule isoform X2 [Chinchilla lanigera]|uniref:Signaling lymphocytic activation molecule family member 1 n=1 Tax=Chinchilla lanigera TaxID=34839 RepID=A0A8C2W2A3_CHILA|nr:PREDICTED: signaling lymphocytic activation molecule isoform X2 [Chinchilla lanigera]